MFPSGHVSSEKFQLGNRRLHIFAAACQDKDDASSFGFFLELTTTDPIVVDFEFAARANPLGMFQVWGINLSEFSFPISMGHRHVFSPSYMFETDNDQRWDLIEHQYAPDSGDAESSSLAYPANNMSIDGDHCSTPAPVSNAYSSLAHNAQNLYYQQDTSGPSNLPTGHESYENIASSSNYNRRPIHEDDNERWQYKRKSPANTNRYTSSSGDNNNNNNNNNNSGSYHMSTNRWDEAQNMGIFHTRWEHPNVKRGHEGESSVRNVRSRAAPNMLSNGYYTTSRPMDVSSGGSMREREREPTYMSSSSSHSHESNPFLIGSSSSSENGIITRNNHVQSTQVQSVRGARIHYIQRSSSLQSGHSDDRWQLNTESCSSAHIRPNILWRSSDRNAQAMISDERYRPFSEEVDFHDPPEPDGLMIMDRSAFGSRNAFDYHRDMRLDIDDMSYEELLALGERIGSVSTGLSDNLIAKCLRESTYSSSDQTQAEEKCVICLEEYADMDDVGMLKGSKVVVRGRPVVFDEAKMREVLLNGLVCSHPDPMVRPTMRNVVQMLVGEAVVLVVSRAKPTISYSTSHLLLNLQDNMSDLNGIVTLSGSSSEHSYDDGALDLV
ncbi:hypothetical protein QVD17_14754 [Tagetes erecta]|uniref:RING-type E3 ubiquitin transferase n=1 Tax=Tagetes erecta TaxID=13708 RepID=A0AAD8KRX2_TARER|nr:hypothetical protein QVD17_14754 [Tagetes erecta]